MKRLVTRIIVFIFAMALVVPGAANSFAADKTSTDYALFKTKGRYVSQPGLVYLYEAGLTMRKYMDENSPAIPGLKNTVGVEDGSFFSSDSYVPQGIVDCWGKYIISAYDAAEKRNSVLYVVDKEDHSVATITLPHNYHNGGLAYDYENHVLWLCGNTSGKYKDRYFVFSVDMYDVWDAIEDTDVGHLRLNDMNKIYIDNKPSCLSFSKNRLWVGTCTSKSYIIGYLINKDGTSLDVNNKITLSNLDSSLNGFDLTSNSDRSYDVVLSYSTGRSSTKVSYLTKVVIPRRLKNGTVVDVKNFLNASIQVPRMNEEILYDYDEMILLFESGAKKFKDACSRTDRIAILDNAAWDDVVFDLNSVDDGIPEQTITDNESASISYSADEESEEYDTIAKLGFTPESSGEYLITLSNVASDDNICVEASLADDSRRTLGSVQTGEYDENLNDFIVNPNGSNSFILRGGHHYSIYSNALALDDRTAFNGSYNLTVEKIGDAPVNELVEGKQLSAELAAGQPFECTYTPSSTGAYQVNWESDVDLASQYVIDSEGNEIPFNDRYVILKGGVKYNFDAYSEEDCNTSIYLNRLNEGSISTEETKSISEGQILSYRSEINGRNLVTITNADELALAVYDNEGNIIAIGDENVVFETESGAEYKILAQQGCGDIEISRYQIPVKDLNITVDVPATNKYSGYPINGRVTVVEDATSLQQGQDYNVEFKYNTGVGKGRAVITGLNEYTGSYTYYFKIIPKTTSVKKLTAGKKKLTVTMPGTASSTGGKYYQVQYRVKGTSAWKSKKGFTGKSTTLSRLKKGKYYQVRVRGYKTVNGTAYYGNWSKIKTSGRIK